MQSIEKSQSEIKKFFEKPKFSFSSNGFYDSKKIEENNKFLTDSKQFFQTGFKNDDYLFFKNNIDGIQHNESFNIKPFDQNKNKNSSSINNITPIINEKTTNSKIDLRMKLTKTESRNKIFTNKIEVFEPSSFSLSNCLLYLI